MSHLDEFKRLNHESINSLIVASGIVKLSSKSVQLIFNALKESVKKNNLFAKFAQPELLENEECFTNTGFHKDEFQYILNALTSLKNSIFRNKSQALAIYLYWLRNGLGQFLE
jgi:hypothetical protein